MRPLSDPLHSKSLYIAHLAQRLEALEQGVAPPAVTYRLVARRLHSALAGYPEAMAARLGDHLPCVLHALSQRHFDVHGVFAGADAARARLHAFRLFDKLGCTPLR